MNTYLSQILYIIISSILPIATAFIVTFLKKKIAEINTNIENQLIKKYIDFASSAVLNAVTSVSQTYVDAKKKEGTFDEEAKQRAKQQAIILSKTLINEESIKAINMVYSDFETWLDTQIETSLRKNK